MRLVAVTIKDLATGAFMQPTFHHHPAQAVRAFTDEVNREDKTSLLYQHPEDFEMWQLSFWDDQTGTFEPAQERLLRGTDAKRPTT